MGLTDDTISAISSQLWGFFSTEGLEHQRLREIGLDPTDRRLAQTLELIHEIQGFPRHLSQHVGGFIMTEGRLDELVPIENATMEDRTVICWDKDDIDALGILKVDVLALGMLTCIRKAFDLIRLHHRQDWTLATLPPEDPATYDMLCKADSLGVFQVESRAQMNFLPRMRPRTFYDLVIQVAIIRPGPIQGDMVHPYLRRRNGEEKVHFPSDALGQVLGKTLGVPLFQEQAMQIAIVGAGFTPEEADRLRRALATFKKHGNVSEFHDRFLKGMARNGYDADFAQRCFSQIEGFGSYGFPESHAASFALLVYASAWLKRHHPGIFACALLNAQPMGFYAPAQIVRDAREHGVTVLPVCINASYWDNVMERLPDGTLGLRLGFRQIKSMREEESAWISAARGNGYHAVEDVWRRAGVEPRLLRVLAEADAFATLGLSRRDALWAARALAGDTPLPSLRGRHGRRRHRRGPAQPARHDRRRGGGGGLRRHAPHAPPPPHGLPARKALGRPARPPPGPSRRLRPRHRPHPRRRLGKPRRRRPPALGLHPALSTGITRARAAPGNPPSLMDPSRSRHVNLPRSDEARPVTNGAVQAGAPMTAPGDAEPSPGQDASRVGGTGPEILLAGEYSRRTTTRPWTRMTRRRTSRKRTTTGVEAEDDERGTPGYGETPVCPPGWSRRGGLAPVPCDRPKAQRKATSGRNVVRTILPISALLLGSFFLLFAGGIHGLILPVRGTYEGFSAFSSAFSAPDGPSATSRAASTPPASSRASATSAPSASWRASPPITILLQLISSTLELDRAARLSGFCFAGAAMIVESWLSERADPTTAAASSASTRW
jgi:hypothetical protein